MFGKNALLSPLRKVDNDLVNDMKKITQRLIKTVLTNKEMLNALQNFDNELLKKIIITEMSGR